MQFSLLAAVLNCNCTVVNSIRSVAGVFISPRAELSFLISMCLISQSIWCLKEIALKDEDDESNISDSHDFTFMLEEQEGNRTQ